MYNGLNSFSYNNNYHYMSNPNNYHMNNNLYYQYQYGNYVNNQFRKNNQLNTHNNANINQNNINYSFFNSSNNNNGPNNNNYYFNNQDKKKYCVNNPISNNNDNNNNQNNNNNDYNNQNNSNYNNQNNNYNNNNYNNQNNNNYNNQNNNNYNNNQNNNNYNNNYNNQNNYNNNNQNNYNNTNQNNYNNNNQNNYNNSNQNNYNYNNNYNNQNNYNNNNQNNYNNNIQNNNNYNNNYNNQNNYNNNNQNNYNNNNQNNYNNNIQNNYNNNNQNNNNFNKYIKSNDNKKEEMRAKTCLVKKNKDNIKLNFMVRARGLINVGATCYMNATLQCFYHVKALSENLINDNNINKKMEITSSFKDVIEKLAGCSNKKIFRYYNVDEKTKDNVEPIEFKDIIGEKNPLFKGKNACDSKDLILFMLESMDKELTIRNNKNDKIKLFVGKDLSEMEDNNYKKCHNSIISDLFYGFQKSNVMCDSCKYLDNTFTVINFLLFPLEKTYNSLNKNNNNNAMNMMNMMNMMYMMNNNNMNNNYMYMNNINPNFNNILNRMSLNNHNMNNYFNNNNNINQLNCRTTIQSKRNLTLNAQNDIQRKLTLDDCFKEFLAEDLLSGQNKIYCNHCHKYSNAITKNELYKAPNILILILNRGRGNYFKCDLDFPKYLDISKYLINNDSPKYYDLIGVISHFGESNESGHFMAFCKHFDLSWYIFNDAIVKQVSENDIYRGVPYILFYQNKDLNEE